MEKKPYILYFNTRDELVKINLEMVVCFEAEANYLRVSLVNGLVCMIRMSLGKMESILSTRAAPDKFVRIGKRFIVNLSYIFSINVLKQELVLSDQRSFVKTLSVSKDALKQLKELMKRSHTQIQND